MLDVLVTCHPHAGTPSYFPEVRGHQLAVHLARTGLRAEFRSLPAAAGARCRVLICSEYQTEMDWFDRVLRAGLAAVPAGRLYCLTEYTLGARDHFSREYVDWFAARGGVLAHLEEEPPGPGEHVIGVGVDVGALAGAPERARDTVVFDFPALVARPDAKLEPGLLEAVRRRLPHCRLIGTGPAGAHLRADFDEWVPYGQPHADYLRAVLPGAFAFVTGLLGSRESMGLALAEAQAAGACVVTVPEAVKEPMLVPEGHVLVDAPSPGRRWRPQLGRRRSPGEALAAALLAAERRDGALVRAQALERFDYAAVAGRTRRAIGL